MPPRGCANAPGAPGGHRGGGVAATSSHWAPRHWCPTPFPGPRMNSNAELLKELRIDRNARQAPPPRRGLWIGIAIAVAVVALLALAGWWLFGRATPVDVQTAAVVAFASGGAE